MNELRQNRTVRAILLNMLIAFVSLFANGFGVYLTIQANIGTGPVMQLAFRTVRFDPKKIRHQNLRESAKVVFGSS